MDPADEMFDPLKAALLHFSEGNNDEAYWLVFLFTHFGRHRRGSYLYARSVYGRFGEDARWDWKSTSSDPDGFRKWLDTNQERLETLPTAFGNHRKYESLHAYSDNGTGATVATYVAWVDPPRSHQELFDDTIAQAGGDAKKAFHALYESMNEIRRFGRTARFDYLAMIGKLGFAALEPDSPYLGSATGPVKGAKLLFAGSPKAKMPVVQLDELLIRLDTHLQLGMQAIEDAVCNWQKSPDSFKSFRG
jgi:alpha-glutamyl/putrescinyl thymine pyrophosphorylase-like protein